MLLNCRVYLNSKKKKNCTINNNGTDACKDFNPSLTIVNVIIELLFGMALLQYGLNVYIGRQICIFVFFYT